MDDLLSLDVCLIGSVIHADSRARRQLKAHISGFHSPFLKNRIATADRRFDSLFGEESLARHFTELPHPHRIRFLEILCSTGSIPILEPFMNLEQCKETLATGKPLGKAAAAANTEVVNKLLAIGVNGVLAIPVFLDPRSGAYTMNDQVFKRILHMLVRNARQMNFDDERNDALLAILHSEIVMAVCPETIGILLSKGIFCARFLFGRQVPKDDYLNLVIERGCYKAVELLLQYGADVTARTRDGKTVIHKAMTNNAATHPRRFFWYYWGWLKDEPTFVAAEADADILDNMRKVFDLRFQGSQKFEDYGNPSTRLEPPKAQKKSVSRLRMLLDTVLASRQIKASHKWLECLFPGLSPMSSLSFFEALSVRFLFGLSYVLLFAYEVLAFATGQKRIQMPSRNFFSGVAMLLLAVHWTCGWMEFSWGE